MKSERSSNAPINVMHHYPPPGIQWGQCGGLTNQILKFPCSGPKVVVKSPFLPMLPLWGPWGILSTTAPLPLKPYSSQMRIVCDKVKCPCMGRNFCVNSPMMTPKAPRWGVVGHNIDRHIIPPGHPSVLQTIPDRQTNAISPKWPSA